jgi:antitoxin ParD1/3/4
MTVIDRFCHEGTPMSMTSMNISLPQELREYVEEKTKAGYSTPSEFIRELIRRDQKRQARERLNALLLEGLDSGVSIRTNSKFWAELRRDAIAKASGLTKPKAQGLKRK